MKNPFEKNDRKVPIADIVIGSLVAGATAHLFLIDTVAIIRGARAECFNRVRGGLFGREAEAVSVDHSKDYLKPTTEAPKTYREKLLKHKIHTPDGSAEHVEGLAKRNCTKINHSSNKNE